MPGLPGFVIAVMMIFAAAVSLAVYLLPVLVGWQRHVRNLGSVAAINVLLGWTLVGWVVALAMALRTVGPAAAVQVINNPPPYPPPAVPHPPPGPGVTSGRAPSAAPRLFPLAPPPSGGYHEPPASPDPGNGDDAA